MNRILFVCIGNTCRSPMAAALYNQKRADIIGSVADSAGLAVFYPSKINPLAKKVLKENFAIKVCVFTAKQVTPELIAHSDLVVTMTGEQAEVLAGRFPQFAEIIMSLGELAGEPQIDVTDPLGGDEQDYKQTARLILQLIEKSAGKIDEIFTPGQGQDKPDPL